MSALLIQGSAHALPLRDESVQCVVTSPPYFGSVRVYRDERSPWSLAPLGAERDPEQYVAHLVEVFEEVRRVVRPDGCCWLNLGDVYAASGKGGGGLRGVRTTNWMRVVTERRGFRMPPAGYKMKDLTLVAFQVADALRRAGWYLRATVIWDKLRGIEPVRLDRPSVSHEYVFLLTRSEHYTARDPGETWWGKSVWGISPHNSVEHPATMPEELARRAILAGSRPGDVVLDPFNGSGTTGRAALQHGRSYVGVDISREYLIEQAIHRIDPLAGAQHDARAAAAADHQTVLPL